ncbi:MAG: hypothetical protein GY868_01420, partial [Deltaproteobacteria bacterium]|nr:hypothetical protein [Deltaproteobacteria bacterium]
MRGGEEKMGDVTVQPMRCVFASNGVLRIDNIGAGMGMVVYSPSRKVAAGVHVLRAQPTEREVPNPAYFATTAISHIVETFK